jgi:hypothetical protein
MMNEYAGNQDVATIFLRAMLDKNAVIIAKSPSKTMNF